MSTWTWPWKNRRRVLGQQRQSRDVTAQVLLGLRYGSAALFVLALIFRPGYNGSMGSFMEFDTEVKNSAERISLAVVTAGTTQRFLFDPFLNHIAGSQSLGGTGRNKRQVEVDYFAILTLQAGAAFRADLGYMGYLAGRDILFNGILNSQDSKKVSTIQKQMLMLMSGAVSGLTKDSGVTTTIKALRLLDAPIEDAPILDVIRKRDTDRLEKLGKFKEKEEYDLFQTFPMLDMRGKALKRTRSGNKNMIRLFLAQELLWKEEVLLAEKKRGNPYDYVMILRDDTMWLEDLDLQKVIDTDPSADAYILSCDARDPQMLPPEINDHGVMMKREKADVIGAYVTSMVNIEMKKCHESVEFYLGPNRGCNSEMILKFILEEYGIKVKLVPQSLLPFERSVVISGERSGRGMDFYCYHKMCQSTVQPLELPSGMERCKEVTFPKVKEKAKPKEKTKEKTKDKTKEKTKDKDKEKTKKK